MKKILLVVFPACVFAALVLWYFNSRTALLFTDEAGIIIAFGRLAGLVAAAGVMGQLLVMSRAGWLEPLLGTALPVKWHHRAGLLIPLALLVHPPLVVWHYALQSGQGFMAQYFSTLRWDHVIAAACGEALIIAAVALSLPFARRRLSYAAWHRVHLGVYAGLALSIAHQLALGGDLHAEKPYFARIWYALLVFTAGNTLWYRLLKPRLAQTE